MINKYIQKIEKEIEDLRTIDMFLGNRFHKMATKILSLQENETDNTSEIKKLRNIVLFLGDEIECNERRIHFMESDLMEILQNEAL